MKQIKKSKLEVKLDKLKENIIGETLRSLSSLTSSSSEDNLVGSIQSNGSTKTTLKGEVC